MQELHAADRNHVWAYYIRNMIRPAVIAEEKVDRIIGNPAVAHLRPERGHHSD